jgi:hypothetical protein
MTPFVVTDTGYPLPKLTVTGLPTGVRFTDNENRTGTIAGTPRMSATYLVRITAANPRGATHQTMNLMVSRVVTHRTLVVLAGQSNATGAGSWAVDPTTGINYFAPPYTNGADAASTISWAPSFGIPPPKGGGMTGQVPLDSPQLLGDSNTPPNYMQFFGPEIGWARQIYADTGQAVSVIKVAIAGTSLAVDWNPSTRLGYFSQMVATVTSTMSADAQAGQLDTIGGIAWFQGEADAQVLTQAADYESNLKAFISALRSDLPTAPSTPVVLVKESLAAYIAESQRLGQCGTTKHCSALSMGDTEVRGADDWAAANLANVLEVDSLGLPREFDAPSFDVHLANTGELTVGDEINNAISSRARARVMRVASAVPGTRA